MSCIGITIPLFVYTTIALLGYIEYFKVKPNYLETIEMKNIGKTLFIYLYVAFIVMMLLSFPLVFFEAKNIYLTIIDELFYNKKVNPPFFPLFINLSKEFSKFNKIHDDDISEKEPLKIDSKKEEIDL